MWGIQGFKSFSSDGLAPKQTHPQLGRISDTAGCFHSEEVISVSSAVFPSSLTYGSWGRAWGKNCKPCSQTPKLLLSAGICSQAECAGGQTGGLYMTDLVRGGSVGWKRCCYIMVQAIYQPLQSGGGVTSLDRLFLRWDKFRRTPHSGIRLSEWFISHPVFQLEACPVSCHYHVCSGHYSLFTSPDVSEI